MLSSRRFIIGLGALLAAVGSVVAMPLPALAEDATTVAFVETGTVTADFASPWVLTIAVTGSSGGGEDGYSEDAPESGTVDVYVDGIAGAYASALPIQADGVAYFAQPVGQPLLAAGTYTVRAIFNPLAGSRVLSSQTTTPATLTINPLTVNAAVTATMDASVADVPIVTASLSGSYVEALDGSPAGIWTFTVRDPDGEIVFTEAVAQEGLSTGAVQIGIDTKLARDAEFAVESVFTPDPAVAPGLTVTQAPTVRFTSAAATAAELLVAPVAIPWWAIALGALLILLLVTSVVWLAVLVARRRRKARDGERNGRLPSVGESAATPLNDVVPDSGLATLVRVSATKPLANLNDEGHDDEQALSLTNDNDMPGVPTKA